MIFIRPYIRSILIGSIALAVVLAIAWILIPSGVPEGALPANPPVPASGTPSRSHVELSSSRESSKPPIFSNDDIASASTSRAPQNTQDPGALGADLAVRNLDEALARVKTFASPKDRRAFVQGMFKALAARGDLAALSAAKRMENKDRETALVALLDEWSTSNLSPVERAHLIMEKGLAGAICSELLDGGQTERALLLTNSLLTGPDRAKQLADVALTLSETDPGRAAQLADSTFTAEQKATLLGQVAAGWAKKDPESAWAWASQFSAENGGAAIQASALQSWATKDPAGAAAMALSLPQGQPRTAALGVIAQEWAAKDTKATLQWAQQFSNPDERATIDRNIASVAPTGIGIMISPGEGGLTVGDIVPGGPAGNSGLLQKGDRIVGVGQGNGQFTPLQGLPLDQAINMIRGQTGTQVRLLVDPADNGAQRIVPLTRQQILHKR